MSSLPLRAIKSDRLACANQPLPRPLRLAVEGGLLNVETTFLDYGGDTCRTRADVVYLGYVLNLLESPEERCDALREAWKLTGKVLVVAAPVTIDDRKNRKIAYGKEQVTPLNPFQTYYEHPELKRYIDEILGVEAVPATLGVYFIFREAAEAENYRFSVGRSRIITPTVKPFPNCQEILTSLMDFFIDRGRLPSAGELSTEAELIAEFGSLEGAFEMIREASDRLDWETIAENCRQNLLIYLACHGLNGETLRITSLPKEIQNDITAFFDNFEEANDRIIEMLSELEDSDFISKAWQDSAIGKKLPGALYVHTWALEALDPKLRLYEAIARRTIGRIDGATLVKFSTDKPKISYLFYPNFDTEAHPALEASLQIDLPDVRISYRDYTETENPPVLHRKEAFVTRDYPLYEIFANLTRQEEKLGLLNNSRAIGTRKGWLECLADYNVEIENHTAIARRKKVKIQAATVPKIERHRAAIVRRDLSRPMRLALEAGLFTKDSTFFDYGCGHGGDLKRMAEQGYQSNGWDPYYQPDTPLTRADVVNLGYVINVIEDQVERREALIKAWELTQKVLIVAALVLIDDQGSGQVAYGDGVITRRNTFQKYYEQEELKAYIEGVLNVEATPAALGIYFVFRDERMAQIVRAYRFRSRTTIPRVLKSFDDYRELLTPLMEFVSDRGRLPVKGELPQEAEIIKEFGTMRRAFKAIAEVTHAEEWEAIAEKRRKDILSYIAILNFGGRTKLSNLPPEIQNDIKGLFASYQNVCLLAQQLVFSLNDLNLIANCCQQSKIGLLTSKCFTIHVSALEALEPLLRIYEGVVSRAIGRMDEATLIQFHINKPKISYLFYPNFDTDPHPVLYTSMQIDLEDFRVTYRDYDIEDDPPILHRKEACVMPDYPLYQKFAKLTRQEENWGLLDNPRAIHTRKRWLKCLEEHCAEIRSNQVYWRKDADPYRVKLVRSQRRSRKKNNNNPNKT